MMTYINALGLDVWECVSAKYVPPFNPINFEKGVTTNEKPLSAIISCLEYFLCDKVLHINTTK